MVLCFPLLGAPSLFCEIVSGALLLTWLTRGTALPRALAAVMSVSLFLWLWASPTLFGQTVESFLPYNRFM